MQSIVKDCNKKVCGVNSRIKSLEFTFGCAENNSAEYGTFIDGAYMKKIIAVFFCTIITITAFAQISFVPSIDIFSLLTFQKEKPYVQPSFDSTVHFNIQAFPQAYFDTSFNFLIDNPLKFFRFDKNTREPVQAFFLNSAISFPKIKNKNLYLALFYGQYDYLNSDKILRETAKVTMESPDFQKYFPTSVFKPDLKVDGLGTAVYGSLDKIPVFFAGYFYWNGNYTKEGYGLSFAFRTGYSFPSGAVNFFTGADLLGGGKQVTLRTGMSGLFNIDNNYEFYVDAGFDKFDVADKTFYNKFYALFEPRIIYNAFNFSIPFFMAPVSSLPTFSNNMQYAGSTFAGIGLKLAGGNIAKYNFEAGAAFCASVNPQNISELTAFTFSASPFITYAFSNYTLDFRVNLYPVLYNDPINMVNLTLQLKAVR